MSKLIRLAVAAGLLAGALALPLACAGAETRAASAHVEQIQSQLEVALQELEGAQAALVAARAAPGLEDMAAINALESELAATGATVDALGKALKRAIADLPKAWERDIQAAASAEGQDKLIGGALSLGGAQGGLIGIASTIALSLWRDRRKARGRDPLQREDVWTPPPANPA